MPLSSPVVFPLLPIEDGRCGCGAPACKRIGKHPAVLWGDVQAGSAVPLPEPGAGYAIKTGAAPKGSGVIVVDIDGMEAAEAWSELEQTLGAGENTPDTYTVQTPRGLHMYFEHPGFHVGCSAGALARGIDVRGDGGFVVGPGSPHKSGESYILEVDLAPAPAPAWLLKWLRSRPAPAAAQPHASDVADPVERKHRRELYTRYLETAPPCVEGNAGDRQLFEVVQYGAYDLALPTEDVLDLVREVYDPRCDPPWGDELDERVTHKSNSAKASSTRPRIEPVPAEAARLFTLEPPPKPPPMPEVIAPAGAKKRDSAIFWDDWDEPIDPPTWLVEGLIPVSTVGGFVAHGSSLKTWTAISLAGAVAQGVPWLDKYPTKRGRVLILDYESGEYEMRRRVRLLEGGRVVGLGAWSMPGKNIDDVELWKELAAIPDISLVIIDSLAAGTSPNVDENGKEAAFPLLLAARYSEGTGAAVLFIHHSKKDDGGDARKAVRGSTAIYAAMDWCYGFQPIEETSAYKRMQMECIKPCMGARPMPVPIELTDGGLHLYEGEGKLERDAPDDQVQAKILLALQGGPIESKALIAKRLGMRAQVVGMHVEALEVRREIVFIRGTGFMLDGEADRKRRVVEAMRKTENWRTAGQIAKAAHVDMAVIDALMVDCVIVRSAEGRFILTQQANSYKPDIAAE
jgi:hypothetical protein